MSDKTKTIEELGWKDRTVAEFLDLTPEESAFIESQMRAILATGSTPHEIGEVLERVQSSTAAKRCAASNYFRANLYCIPVLRLE